MIRTQIITSVLLTLTFTLFTGLVFPLIIWLIAQFSFPFQANGSFLQKDGQIIASELIGQNFSSESYFHGRPSAAGSGYDAMASGGTNLGPTSSKLLQGLPDNSETSEIDESYKGITTLAKEYREINGLGADTLLPADAVTRSASGLDPHISPANAELQAKRVAGMRGLKLESVLALVKQNTEDRFLGLFGEPRVNVVKLNLQLSDLRKN